MTTFEASVVVVSTGVTNANKSEIIFKINESIVENKVPFDCVKYYHKN